VPIIFLDEFLGLRPTTAARENGTVVLVRIDDHEFGLVVDGTQTQAPASHAAPPRDSQAVTIPEAASLSTIVVKPIGSLLAQLGIYSGATVLGDGGVVLILDLRGVLRAVELPPQPRRGEAAAATSLSAADSYLVCRTGAGRRIAVPIDTVVRLEQFDGHELQAVGGRRLVRRGDLFTPVVDADRLLGAPEDQDSAGTVNLVVLDDRCGGIGIAVRQILDVAAADSVLQPSLTAPGVAGTLAVGGIATEVLDLAAFLPPTGFQA
jgi:two-component system, chemotaxis family, sensor kinase CheA